MYKVYSYKGISMKSGKFEGEFNTLLKAKSFAKDLSKMAVIYNTTIYNGITRKIVGEYWGGIYYTNQPKRR